MWHKIGSPTGQAKSGTIEEFELGKARYDKDPKSVRLMIYFKDTPPLSLSHIDADQLKQVNDFRSRVSDEGGLYSTFTSTEDFANQVRMHLLKHVLEWQKQNAQPVSHDSILDPSGSGSVSLVDDLPDSILDLGNPIREDLENNILHNHILNMEDPIEEGFDDGILDLEDTFNEEFSALQVVLGRMTGAIVDVGKNIGGRGATLNALIPEDKTMMVMPRELKRFVRV